jgi:hypothetical protein
MRYYALVDPPEFPLTRPLSLLRRPGPTGAAGALQPRRPLAR